MKIGVFGDSFADSSFPDRIWWQCLKKHGHSVQSFGTSGSSILYSAGLIENSILNFDFVIWCLTCPGRISFKVNESDQGNFFHYHPQLFTHDLNSLPSNVKKKILVCNDYIKYIYSDQDDVLISKCIVERFLNAYKNLMIVPCFRAPMDANFNLFKLSMFEIENLFPTLSYENVLRTHFDNRPGHLTFENNDILAELINQNLQPGIFQTAYSNFVVYKGEVSDYFRKK